uniref:DEE repeats protein 15 n=1 Tax=Tineola bisselliella TaxID=93883 RepID=A0A891XIF8_TINBI|nr:DEE repeats protein 15 [Tineola bisselliella]
MKTLIVFLLGISLVCSTLPSLEDEEEEDSKDGDEEGEDDEDEEGEDDGDEDGEDDKDPIQMLGKVEKYEDNVKKALPDMNKKVIQIVNYKDSDFVLKFLKVLKFIKKKFTQYMKNIIDESPKLLKNFNKELTEYGEEFNLEPFTKLMCSYIDKVGSTLENSKLFMHMMTNMVADAMQSFAKNMPSTLENWAKLTGLGDPTSCLKCMGIPIMPTKMKLK